MKPLQIELSDKLKEPLAPWRQSLAGALHRDRAKAHSRYLQVASLDASGFPSNRTLVFRGFIENTNLFTMVTDRRSAKLTHNVEKVHEDYGGAMTQPVAIAWYLTESREQFRFTGTLIAIEEQNDQRSLREVRNTLWNRLSDDAKTPFWGAAPGAPLPNQPNNDVEARHVMTSTPKDFVALMCKVTTCDHLALRPTPQEREKHWIENGVWCSQMLTP